MTGKKACPHCGDEIPDTLEDETVSGWTPCDPDGDPEPDDENVADDDDGEDCKHCHGTGEVDYTGLWEVASDECEKCEGTGRNLSKEEGLGGYDDDTPTFPFKINLGDTD